MESLFLHYWVEPYPIELEIIHTYFSLQEYSSYQVRSYKNSCMIMVYRLSVISTNQFLGAGCAGLVAVRRRCSFGEIVEEEDEEKRATTDGFDPTKSNQNIQNGTSSRNITGSQVVASRSVLGINIATDPRRRSKSRTLEEQEKVKNNTRD